MMMLSFFTTKNVRKNVYKMKQYCSQSQTSGKGLLKSVGLYDNASFTVYYFTITEYGH